MNPHSNQEGYPFWGYLGTGKSVSVRELFGQLASSGRHSALLIDPKGDSARIEPIAHEEIETYIYGRREESAATDAGQEGARGRKDEPEDRGEGSNEGPGGGGTDERG